VAALADNGRLEIEEMMSRMRQEGKRRVAASPILSTTAGGSRVDTAGSTVQRTIMYGTVALTPLRGAAQERALEQAAQATWTAAADRAEQLEATSPRGEPGEGEDGGEDEDDSVTIRTHSGSTTRRKKGAKLSGKEAEDLWAQEAYGRDHLGWGGKCP
jgi:hypothetical protein